MSTLLTEVEKLRAQLAAAETGTELPAQPPQDEPGPRKRTVVDFWFEEYERAHGCKDDAFTSKDAAILNRLHKQFQPSERFAWMIREFHGLDEDWIVTGGWSTEQLAHRSRALNIQWVRKVQEPALRKEKSELETRIRDLASDTRLGKLVGRIGREV